MAERFDEKKLESVYERIWGTHGGERFAALDRSLGPRPPDMLFDAVATFGLGAGAHALDAGCGRGHHACELARRFGFGVTGIDIFDSNLSLARRAVEAEGLADRVEIKKGDIARQPFADESFDLVWCRDMLVHVPDLGRALSECARVLKPGGWMLVSTTHATALLAPGEAAQAFAAIGIVPENLSAPRVEALAASAGLHVVSGEFIGGELMEFYEERDGRCSRELMRLARMTRGRERFVAELGQADYDVAQSVYRWLVYHLLGKLGTHVYTLRKPPPH